jgi:hypothetical protein
MTYADLLRHRLYNQHVTGTPLKKPEDVVKWLGAVQSQDYAGAKWAVAQRAGAITDAMIDRVFGAGAILRTHIMRPTWHFVPPEDIRWMLALTASRVNTVCRSYFRKMKLNDGVFARSHAVLAQALRGGRHLTRAALSHALRQAGVTSPRDDKTRLAFIMMRAELDGVICSGPRIGKQFTYALLDERVRRSTRMDRDEARSELARRYFTSHGPATLKDYMWWSGLTAPDARAGLEAIQSELVREEIDGRSYWRSKRRPADEHQPATAHLLPAYDECFVAYRDRVPFDRNRAEQIARDNGQVVVIDGKVSGSWRRSTTKDAVAVEVAPFVSFSKRSSAALAEAADRYARFIEMPVTLSMT